MCRIDGWWNCRRNRDRGRVWNRRGALKKWGFDKRRAGFAIRGSDWCRSGNGSIDDNSVVFLLVRATGNCEQCVETCQVEPIMEGMSWAVIYQVWSWNGQWLLSSQGSPNWESFLQRSNEDKHVFSKKKGKRENLWCQEGVYKWFWHMWWERMFLCSNRSFMFRIGWGLEVVHLHFYTYLSSG